jgi:ribokinase
VDSKTELHQVSIQGGGPVATALVTARALGCRARIAAKIADDDFGRFILQGLGEAGVDTDFVITSAGSLSPFSFIAISEEDAKRTIFYTHGDVARLSARELDLVALLEGAGALLVDGHHPDAQIAAAEQCRERGIPVIVDAGSLREGMGELVALSDFLIASERFVTEVAPRGEVEDSLLELQEMGPRAVIITLGESGSVGLYGDKLVRQPAHEVDAVDTTGAGDVYHGAFTAAFLLGYSFERSMELASASAALACKNLGGRAGIPDLPDVLSFLGWDASVR